MVPEVKYISNSIAALAASVKRPLAVASIGVSDEDVPPASPAHAPSASVVPCVASRTRSLATQDPALLPNVVQAETS